MERSLNIWAAKEILENLHPLVEDALEENRKRGRLCASKGIPANFTEGDFVLVAREDMSAGEKLALRWRGPRRVLKALSDHVFLVEDLRNGAVEEVHACRLKFYSDPSLNTRAIMSHVLASETGMPVARLMGLVEDEGVLKVRVRWRACRNQKIHWSPCAALKTSL